MREVYHFTKGCMMSKCLTEKLRFALGVCCDSWYVGTKEMCLIGPYSGALWNLHVTGNDLIYLVPGQGSENAGSKCRVELCQHVQDLRPLPPEKFPSSATSS